ncbi:MAG TPA: hypothetical protein VKH37_02940, partial [Ferruginibacter sp.]|nr:hypothetical protein [Ferruginibacter sp.]
TLAAYKTRVSPRDAASITENPNFTSLVGANAGFLHINTGIATQLESAGTPIATYTTDYDGDTRNVSTPDIGADEFAGILLDLTPPGISYTALGNTACLSDRTLSPVTITDASGVNIAAGTRPRLYFKKSTNANTFNDNTSGTDGWKYVEATGGGGSPFSFTTNYSLLNGGAPVVGTTIQYFVVAQDLAGTPNVAINSGTFAATPTSVALTAAAFPLTGTINSYNVVVPGLSGTVTIGAAGNYTSITGATGLFNAINTGGLSGNVTANIIDASVTETGATALNAVSYTGCAGGPFTILIKPNTTATLTGAVASGALIKINGATNVTIDGSNSGGTDRSLTITNTSTTAPTCVSFVSPGLGLGSSNGTIKNCNLNTGVAASVGYGVSIGGSTPGTSGSDNDNMTVQNNNITLVPIGIYANGSAALSAGGDDNLLITGNIIDYNGAVASIGIELGNALTSTVSQNSVSELTSTFQAPTGISLEAGFVSSTVTRNLVSKALTTNTGGYGGRGIAIGTGTAASNLTISNNVVYGVNGSNWNAFGNSSSMGIGVGVTGSSSTITTTTGGVNLYFNSVLMTGSAGTGSTTGITAALYIGSGASALNIRNNSLTNTQTATSSTQSNYAIYSAAANTAFTNINYNDYYSANPGGGGAYVGFLGANQTTIANWRTASGQDVNSISADPLYNNSTNLQPQTGSPLVNAGVTGTGVTIDYLGIARGATPTIGAYEQALDGAPPVITYTPLSNALCLADRTLTATITDASGVNVTVGTKPRLYFK